MTTSPVPLLSRATPAVLAALADLLALLLFAVIGRSSHAEGLTLGGVLETAAPFLLGALVGWLVCRAWRTPGRLPTGVGVWAATAVLGLATRAALLHRLPLTFVLVASLSLGILLIGWRLVGFVAVRTRRGNA